MVDVVTTSADHHDALRQITETFGLTAIQATIALDLQVRSRTT